MRGSALVVCLLVVGCGSAEEAPLFHDVLGAGGAGGAATSSSVAGSGGAASGGAGGAPATCMIAEDCGAPPTAECGSWTCETGACVLVPVRDGTLMAGNVPGDCKILVCDGLGGAEYRPSDDPKDDGNPCTSEVCDGFVQPPSTNKAPNMPCPTGVCDGNGACVECLHGYQCASGSCVEMSCQ